MLITTIILISAASAIPGGGGLYAAYRWLTGRPRSAFAKEIDAATDTSELAEECLEDAHVPGTTELVFSVPPPPVATPKRAVGGFTVEAPQTVLVGDVEIVIPGNVTPVTEVKEEPVEVRIPATMRVDQPEVVIRAGRRVRRRLRATYCRRVLDSCKAKFGTPKPTEANHRAVWRYAQQIMNDHGLRPAHQAEFIPTIVALTFEPTAAEVQAGHVVGSWKALQAGRYDEHLSRLDRWTRKLRRLFSLGDPLDIEC